jgi:SAM-dependent methyltransferase
MASWKHASGEDEMRVRGVDPGLMTAAPDTPAARYDAWYEDKLAKYSEHDLAPWHRQLIPFLPDLTGLRVADLGTGVGALPKYLAEHTAAREIMASDFSETALEKARTEILTGLPNVTVEWQDVQSIQHPDERFDVTICCSTIEHVEQPDLALAELVRVTRRGGTLLLVIPNYMSLTGLYRLGWKLKGKQFREIGQPINHPLLLPVIIWKLRRLGCRITAVDSEHHMLYWPFNRRRHIMIRWVERRPFRWFSRWFGLHAVIRVTRVA